MFSYKNINSYFSLFSASKNVEHHDYAMMTLFHVDVPKNTVFHRIDERSPVDLGKGFIGRENLPKDDLKGYVELNKQFGGWGGTIDVKAAIDFSENGSANESKDKPNVLFTSLPTNKMISVAAFIRETFDTTTQAYKKMDELEVMALGDIAVDHIYYATNELQKLKNGEEVENLMCHINPSLPKTYKLTDILSADAILKNMLKFGCKQAIIHGVTHGVFNVKPDHVAVAEENKHTELANTLKEILDAQRQFFGLKR